MNPVTGREVQERFRRGGSVLLMVLWIIAMTGLGYLTYLASIAMARSMGFGGGLPGVLRATMGRTMFQFEALLLLSAVLLIVPGIAALSVVGEKDRLTLPLLQVSQLRPRQIVAGKLESSILYVLLLIVSVAPVLVVPMLLGGVSLMNVGAALAAITVTAVAVGSVGVWVSAKAKTTKGAIVGTYVLVVVLVLGTGIGTIVETLTFRANEHSVFGKHGREVYSALPSPYAAMISAIDGPDATRNLMPGGTPFELMDRFLTYREYGDTGEGFVGEEEFMVESGVPVPVATAGPSDRTVAERYPNRPPLWLYSLALALVITVLALWRATRLVTVPRTGRRWRNHAAA